MKSSKLKWPVILALTALLLTFTACKDDENEVDPTPNPTPEKEVLIANAGPDHKVAMNENVILDGSASKSSLGNPIKYKWKIISKPEGSIPVILQDESPKASFMPTTFGGYEIELTVSNASGQNSDRVLVNAGAAKADTLLHDITLDTRLPDRIPNSDQPDYIVLKDIAVTARLQVDPGVIIAFESDVRLDINESGSIEALGELDNKITFTGIQKTKGFWKGIVIFSNSNHNLFENTEIVYAGSKNTLSVYKAALTLFGISKAQVSLKNCLISESGGYGLHAAAGSVIREFSGNTFSKNGESGIYLDASNVRYLDKESVFTAENGRNVVEVMSSEINNEFGAPETWLGFDDKAPYRIAGDFTIHTGLELKPGVVIEVTTNATIAINANGYLNAKGTEIDSIKITGEVKTAGYWRGIRSYSNSPLNELEYTEISYGGSSPILSGKKASVAITGANSTMIIKNSKINHSGGFGIFVGYTAGVNADVLTENTFVGNVEGNILDEN